MFSERLKQLGLEEIIKKRKNDEDELARRLRQLTCDYLAGKLQGITDGPNVVAMRQFIEDGVFADRNIKSVSDFVNKQSKDGEWEGETALVLEELLGCKIALTTEKSLKNNLAPNTWGAVEGKKPVLTLCNNDSNTHWQAMIDGKKVNVERDGNCFYRAVARNIIAHQQTKIPQAIKPSLTKEQVAVIENQKNIELTVHKPDKTKTLESQIEQDHKLALQLATEELAKSGQKIGAVKLQEQLLAGFFSKSKKPESRDSMPSPTPQ